jgi:hypothetical protein
MEWMFGAMSGAFARRRFILHYSPAAAAKRRAIVSAARDSVRMHTARTSATGAAQATLGRERENRWTSSES